MKTDRLSLVRIRRCSLLLLTLLAASSFSHANPPNAIDGVSRLDDSLTRQFSVEIQPLLKRYCFDCHQGEASESSVDLSVYQSLESVRGHASQWEQVRGVVRIGAMPPPDSDATPSEDERQRISQWTYQALHAFDCSEPNPPPPITIRRLNNAEYDNTIRDLFEIDIAPSKAIGFLSDDVGNGFDNQGEVLSISPLAFEKYAKAAEWIANQVVVLDPDRLREQTADAATLRVGTSFTTQFAFAQGDYEIQARLRFGRRQRDAVRAEIFLDDERIDEFKVPGEGRSLRWTHTMSPGIHSIRIHFVDDPELELEASSDKLLNIERLEVVGPTEGDPPMPGYHQKLMIAKPNAEQTSMEAATKIIAQLLPRAFRRPATSPEVGRIVAIVERAIDQGATFEEGIQFGIEAILVSPEFLFRIERSAEVARESRIAIDRSPGRSNASEVPIDDHELATRLSYFLWSSMPDTRLFELAAAGQLSKPDVLKAELDRMIESPRADALVAGFFDQWLGLRNLRTVSVDEKTFESWSDKLSDAIARETFLFCQELLRHGGLKDILQADFTYLNPRLADFYGLAFDGQDPATMYLGSNRMSEYHQRLGDYRDEDRWVRTELPENRRGLLTQASILTLTSNPTRTSPVKRGKWVLENILGDPPPPAPPGVPSLEESSAEHQNRTLRQQLEIHRANPSCASCHRVLDPIGLGLENFDAIGRWRTTDEGFAIDAQGEFADGRKFSGPRELLEHLQVEQPKIARHFAAQLLTYALGRGLTRGDSCTLDSIVAQAAAADYRIPEFIRAIVASKPFLYIGLNE